MCVREERDSVLGCVCEESLCEGVCEREERVCVSVCVCEESVC